MKLTEEERMIIVNGLILYSSEANRKCDLAVVFDDRDSKMKIAKHINKAEKLIKRFNDEGVKYGNSYIYS